MDPDDIADQISFENECGLPWNPMDDDCMESIFDDEIEPDQFLSDAEADGDALASAGFGTDEDYGMYASDFNG